MNANSELNGIIINSCEYIFANNNLIHFIRKKERELSRKSL